MFATKWISDLLDMAGVSQLVQVDITLLGQSAVQMSIHEYCGFIDKNMAVSLRQNLGVNYATSVVVAQCLLKIIGVHLHACALSRVSSDNSYQS